MVRPRFRRVRRFGRWVDKQTRVRPFLCALVVLGLLVVPGYFRLENAVNNSNETSHAVALLVVREKVRDEAASLANCQTRNTANKNGRNRFDVLFNAIEIVFSSGTQTPEQKKRVTDFVQSLRAHVPLDASAEDVDCNHNGFLDPIDYST
jgi:hypothetical protein